MKLKGGEIGGQAIFTITATKETGNAKVKFKIAGGSKTTVTVFEAEEAMLWQCQQKKHNPLAPFIKGDFLKSPLEKGIQVVVWLP